MFRSISRWPLAAVLVVVAVLFGATGSATAGAHRAPRPTIVLVHGAFADASG